MKGVKQRLKEGELVIGTFLSLGNAIATEIVGNAGFDWVIIDLEHGLGSEGDVAHQLLGLKNTGVAAIIRVEGFQRQRIHRVLDLGANGIMFPRIDNADEAELAIKAMRYPPEGVRGVAKMIRAAGYGSEFEQYRKNIKNELLGIIQIETLDALKNLENIAEKEGVDVLFIGPSDLSMALGIFGQTDSPLFIDTVKRIIHVAANAGKQVGILLADPLELKKYYDLGIRFVACGTEAGFLSKGAKQTADAMLKTKELLQKIN